MIIAHNVNKKIGICDIETLLDLFYYATYNPDTKEWKSYEISHYKNEIFGFIKDYNSSNYDYLVTYNGINFDQQVLEYIVDNYQKWIDYTNLQICETIYNFAKKVIDDNNYGLFPAYREDKFSVPSIDLFKIHHFDNENRMTSLKWCEFMMNMDVEEMPIAHDKKDMTEDEVTVTKNYCKHDIMATYNLLLLTLGETDVPELADYKGKNKIQDRLDIEKESGLKCLNWSDVKIGEEWNKAEYMRVEHINDEKSIHPQKVKHPYGQKFKNFFPKTMLFTTEKLNNFIKKVGNTYVLAEKQEFPITIGETTYTVAKGGLHSTEKNRKTIIPYGFTCKDADVGAQYPNSIIKLLIFPPHLKKSILDNFIGTIAMKDRYKQLGKESKDKQEILRLKGLEGGTKLRLNGGLN